MDWAVRGKAVPASARAVITRTTYLSHASHDRIMVRMGPGQNRRGRLRFGYDVQLAAGGDCQNRIPVG